MTSNTFSKQYIQDAIKTESNNFDEIKNRFTEENIRLLHSAIGVSTEAGELLDALKKHLYYGKPLDKVNLEEEMGDLFWYLAIMANALDVDFAEIMDRNIAKLKARYGEKFDNQKATKRNLDTERQILESSSTNN
ncbi:MAG TPA: nucleoside triphosphate pyrophosphohydrolase family protein [Vampirovibrionales bacterium]